MKTTDDQTKLLAALAVGVALGAAAVLLLVPQTRKELQAKVREKSKKPAGKLHEFTTKLKAEAEK